MFNPFKLIRCQKSKKKTCKLNKYNNKIKYRFLYNSNNNYINSNCYSNSYNNNNNNNNNFCYNSNNNNKHQQINKAKI